MTETHGALLADRYRLLEQLGRGGMGVVWLARDEVFNRDVAVKEVLLPAEIAAGEREHVIQRTLKEARVAARLSHPNVVKVYDVVRAGGRPWIVMELIRARSLTELIEENGPLPPVQVAKIGLQVLAALGAAHAAGINHRDVKPGNVLCGDDGRVVLTDFGIASLDGDNSTTSTGPLMGSPSYIAPERVRGRPASPSSDLWSLAATLYAAVEGRPPYDRDGVVPTVTAVVNEDPDPYRLAGPLAPILDGMFQKEPADRPTGPQIRTLLRDLAGEPRRHESEPSPLPLSVFDTPEPDLVPSDALTQVGMPPVPAAPGPGDEFMSAEMPEHINAPFAPPGRAEDKKSRGPKFASITLAAAAVAMLLAGGIAGINVLFGADKTDRVGPGSAPAALEPSFSAVDPTAAPTQEGQLIVPAAGESTSPTPSPVTVSHAPSPKPAPPAPKPKPTPSPVIDAPAKPSATPTRVPPTVPSPAPTVAPSPTTAPTPTAVSPPPPGK